MATTVSQAGQLGGGPDYNAQQAQIARGNVFLLPIEGGDAVGPQPAVPHDGPRTDDTGSGSAPHVVLTPLAPSGRRTSGIQLGIGQLPGVQVFSTAGGFTITVYQRNPVTGSWFALAPVTIGVGELWICDMPACELYFTVAVATIDSFDATPYAATTGQTAYIPLEIMEI